jgi:GxxExxY protein
MAIYTLFWTVPGELVLELKTVEALSRTHYAQVRSTLKAAALPTALLVNFATARADFRRIDHSSPFR